MAKYSRQRELIKNNLCSRYDHPTADDIYMSIREELPNISLGTVYRNLSQLTNQGEILCLNMGDGKDHFDGNINPHYHFRCKQCGCVQDIFIDELEINNVASNHFDGNITGHETYFYGFCKNCVTNRHN